ncbi:MAG: Calx-beta domain-containing protein [Pseudomonadota bacterium]
MSKLANPFIFSRNRFSWLSALALASAGAAAGDLPVVSITSVDAQMAEAALDTGSFLVSRQGGDVSQELRVNLIYGGTAVVLQGDYETPPSQVLLGANVESQLIELTPRSDNLVEGTETVEVTPQSLPEYEVGPDATATLEIEDDPAVLTIAITDAAISEIGLDPGSFEVSRSGGRIEQGFSGSVAYTGTATPLFDFVQATSFSFAGGQTSTSVTLTPVSDNVVEGDETITVTFLPNSQYITGDPDAVTFTLTDDAPVIEVSVLDADMSEAGPNPGAFLLTRSGGGDPTQAIAVNYTLGGSAGSPQDFVVMGGTVIAANELTLQLDLQPQADSDDMEGDETIEITLQPSPSYLIGPANTATVVLRDFVDLIFAAGFETAEKACFPIRGKQLSSLGPVVFDPASGLMWARCGVTGVFSARSQRCYLAPSFDSGRADQTSISSFNAGRSGDNAGFSDWRKPRPEELKALSLGCQARQAVR